MVVAYKTDDVPQEAWEARARSYAPLLQAYDEIVGRAVWEARITTVLSTERGTWQSKGEFTQR